MCCGGVVEVERGRGRSEVRWESTSAFWGAAHFRFRTADDQNKNSATITTAYHTPKAPYFLTSDISYSFVLSSSLVSEWFDWVISESIAVADYFRCRVAVSALTTPELST